MPTLEALATATPENRVDQERIQEIVRAFLEENAPEHLDMVDVFTSTGIESRALSRDIDFYLSSPGWGERSRAFEQTGTALAEEVTLDLLDQADLPTDAIDGVVLVNTTGLATPSIDALLANRVGLREDVHRIPVWGWGCAGGVAGLARAADMARAHPDGRYLMVSLELCSLAFLEQDLSKKNLVATALFGDGCAGALVSGDELEAEGPTIDAAASHQWRDTEDVMGWDVRDVGLDVVFSHEIPEIVSQRLRPIVDRFCKRTGQDLHDARPVLHPGGPKVLSAYEEALGLDADDLEASRTVLRRHGNMSSPTVLFTLEESLAGQPLATDEPALLGAVGPGFACELAMLTGS